MLFLTAQRTTIVLCAISICFSPLAVVGDEVSRPNILWVTSEDNGPELGCYGDQFADTPNIDQLAARGMIYQHAWSTAPVCAPARTTIISGMYPPSTGAEHMRSMVSLPEGFKMFPQLLREVGYYCTNNVKEDYNLRKPGQVWDDSSRQAHWKNRRERQPFFAVFNHTVSHESQIRIRPHKPVHDPAEVPLPPYHPDVPEVRRDWAQYYDKLTEMDALVGKSLQELEEAGLLDDTIVFYYGDHGSGMPRSKRWLYQSGLHVPMIVHVPEKFRAVASGAYQVGGSSERLVGFIDLAPTVLSLAGVDVPNNYQGHAFLGPDASTPQKYLYGFRGRMDERIDLSRAVRDNRYLYIRNYMPHKPRGQFLAYMFETPTTQVWKKLYDEGRLQPPQTYFWETKAPEELYDLESDRFQIHNLVDSDVDSATLARLRKANRDHLLSTRDLGFLPEAEMHARCVGRTPYELGHDDQAYPLPEILRTAEEASDLGRVGTGELIEALTDSESAVRYWAAMGMLMRGKREVDSAFEQLSAMLEDSSPNVQIVAAEALAEYGPAEALSPALSKLLQLSDVSRQPIYVAIAALASLDSIDERAKGVVDRIQALPTVPEKATPRYDKYVLRLLKSTLSELGASPPSQ